MSFFDNLKTMKFGELIDSNTPDEVLAKQLHDLPMPTDLGEVVAERFMWMSFRLQELQEEVEYLREVHRPIEDVKKSLLKLRQRSFEEGWVSKLTPPLIFELAVETLEEKVGRPIEPNLLEKEVLKQIAYHERCMTLHSCRRNREEDSKFLDHEKQKTRLKKLLENYNETVLCRKNVSKETPSSDCDYEQHY